MKPVLCFVTGWSKIISYCFNFFVIVKHYYNVHRQNVCQHCLAIIYVLQIIPQFLTNDFCTPRNDIFIRYFIACLNIVIHRYKNPLNPSDQGLMLIFARFLNCV